jgi:hypothetical protein
MLQIHYVVPPFQQRVNRRDRAALNAFCKENFPRFEWETERDASGDMVALRTRCNRLRYHIFPLGTGDWVMIDEDQTELAMGRRIVDILKAVRPC